MHITSLGFFMPLWGICLQAQTVPTDPYLWLEEMEGQKAVEWAQKQNAATLDKLMKQPDYEDFFKIALDMLNDKSRIPYASLRNGYFYNFWQDERNVRGVWRRAKFDEYLKENPAWETLLDIDKLGKEENESWVYSGAVCLAPEYNKCMISLSRGGKDAEIIREFDVSAKIFVKDGFRVEESKSNVDWLDENTLLLNSALDKESQTVSGYPRIVRKWKRGTAVKDSSVIFEAKKEDMYGGAYTSVRPEGKHTIITRGINFFEHENWLLGQGGKMTRIWLPGDALIYGFFKGNILAQLRSEWKTSGGVFKAGSLVSAKTGAIVSEKPDGASITAVFSPGNRASIEDVQTTRNYLIVSVLDNIKSKMFVFSYNEKTGGWLPVEIAALSGGASGVDAVNDFADHFTATYEDFITPERLYLIDAANTELKKIKQLPEKFAAESFATEQYYAVSKDGTQVPYFIVKSKTLKPNGGNPALLYGYGGFEISMLPFYSGTIGRLWLERGGTYVLANVRGGGEFGPQWHKAALKENRQKSFDDFIAVAEDLIAKKITSPQKLAIEGGSNGGLLVGAAFTQRPDLFKAVLCQVPLFDMLRYTGMSAGQSWIAEYGDPQDPAVRPALAAYSPYQNLREGIKYPAVFFETSTKDDRVHPGHARKAAAKMLELGADVYYFENMEGGHAAGADNLQKAKLTALEFAFLSEQLKSGDVILNSNK